MIRLLVALVVQELHRPRRARQNRRCPFCNGWFNTPELQDAHERDCDQRPEQADDLTVAQVIDLVFPAYGQQLPEPFAHERARALLAGHRARSSR